MSPIRYSGHTSDCADSPMAPQNRAQVRKILKTAPDSCIYKKTDATARDAPLDALEEGTCQLAAVSRGWAHLGRVAMPCGRSVTSTLVAGLLVSAPTVASALSPGPANPSIIGTCSIGLGNLVRAVPASFLGMSHEWENLPQGSLQNASSVADAYLTLLTHLTQHNTGPWVMRLGGNTQDLLTAAPSPALLAQWSEVHRVTGSRFIYGVNLKAENPALTASMAAAGIAGLPADSILAVEVGNEPDLYTTGLYPQRYTQALSNATAALPAALQGRIAAPALASPLVAGKLPEIIANQSGRLKLVTLHRYEGGARDPTWTAERLLQDTYATDAAMEIASAQSIAHAANISIRYGEFNSLFGGGAAGISNAYAATLWTLDVSFELLRAGLDGVHFHNSARYAAISEGRQDGTAQARPPFYGMLLFQEALRDAAGGVSLVNVTKSTSANLKVWALQDKSKGLRVVIINKDLQAAGIVQVTTGLPGNTPFQWKVLSAEAANATSGISYGGQSWDASKDGLPLGELTRDIVVSNADGILSVMTNRLQAHLLWTDG